jgi:hypothetical protein
MSVYSHCRHTQVVARDPPESVCGACVAHLQFRHKNGTNFHEKQKKSREKMSLRRNFKGEKLTKEREVSFAFGIFIKKIFFPAK